MSGELRDSLLIVAAVFTVIRGSVVVFVDIKTVLSIDDEMFLFSALVLFASF